LLSELRLTFTTGRNGGDQSTPIADSVKALQVAAGTASISARHWPRAAAIAVLYATARLDVSKISSHSDIE